MSQTEAIARYLSRGKSLTPLSALRLFGCMRLGARVHELKRRGFRIKRDIVRVSGGKHVAQYARA